MWVGDPNRRGATLSRIGQIGDMSSAASANKNVDCPLRFAGAAQPDYSVHQAASGSLIGKHLRDSRVSRPGEASAYTADR